MNRTEYAPFYLIYHTSRNSLFICAAFSRAELSLLKWWCKRENLKCFTLSRPDYLAYPKVDMTPDPHAITYAATLAQAEGISKLYSCYNGRTRAQDVAATCRKILKPHHKRNRREHKQNAARKDDACYSLI